MSSTKDVTFRLKCEVDDGALKSVDSIEQRLEKMNKHTKMKLEFDTSDAESHLSKIEKRLEALQDKANIKVSMDDDGVSSRRKSSRTSSSRSSTKQSGRMRQPSRTRADAPTDARPATTARTLPPKAKPRDRAGAAKATSARNTKAPTAKGGSVKGGGRIMKRARLPGALGAIANVASVADMAMGFLKRPENDGRVGPEAYGGSADEYSDVPMTEQFRDRDRTTMILGAGSRGAQNLLSSGLHERDVTNINSTIETATTLGFAGAGITASTGATVLGAGLGTIAAGGVLAGGAGFAAGNYVGRKISGQDEAEAELARNLEREQMLIDGSPAMRAKFEKLNNANLLKIEKEQSSKFRTLSGSDESEFKADLKGLNGDSSERLASIDQIRSKNESQRETAANEASRLAEVLAMAEKAGPNTSFGMQAKGIASDLDAQNAIVKQQEQQLVALAEERLKIEKEIAKTKAESSKSATSDESPRAASSGDDRTKQYADRIGSALETLTASIETKIQRLASDYTNVRNDG